MINKKIMILAIFLVSLLAIGVVSAATDVGDDVVGVGENQAIEQTQIEEMIGTTNEDIQQMSVDDRVLEAHSTDEVLDISQDADVMEVSLQQNEEVLGFSTSKIYVWFPDEPYLVLDEENDFWILNENRVQFPKQSAVKIIAKDLKTGKTYSDSVPIESIVYEYGMENIHYMVCADMFKKIPWTAKHKYLVKVYWVSPEGKSKYLSKKTLQVKVKTNYRFFVRDITTHIYSGEKYGVTVYKSNGQPAANVEVQFFLKNKVFKAKTNSKGVAYFDIPQKVGTYKVSADAPSLRIGSAPQKIKVTHSIDLPKITVKKSAKQLNIKVTLKKIKGKILKGEKITLKFNGKKYTAKTNKKGIAKFTIGKSVLKNLKVGKTIKYSATYLKDATSKSVKVKK